MIGVYRDKDSGVIKIVFLGLLKKIEKGWGNFNNSFLEVIFVINLKNVQPNVIIFLILYVFYVFISLLYFIDVDIVSLFSDV